MIYHASCRDAKTAEEYLLRCLFKAEDERDIIKAIPNFDADKWYQITGIDLRGGGNE